MKKLFRDRGVHAYTLKIPPGVWEVCLTYSIAVSQELALIADTCAHVSGVMDPLRRRYRAVLVTMDTDMALSTDLFTDVFDACVPCAHDARAYDFADVVFVQSEIEHDYSNLAVIHAIPKWANTLRDVLHGEMRSRFVRRYTEAAYSRDGYPIAAGYIGCDLFGEVYMQYTLTSRLIPERIELTYPTKQCGMHPCLTRML